MKGMEKERTQYYILHQALDVRVKKHSCSLTDKGREETAREAHGEEEFDYSISLVL